MDVVPLRMSPKEGSLWWEPIEHDVDFEAQAEHGPKMVHRCCSTYSGDGAGEWGRDVNFKAQRLTELTESQDSYLFQVSSQDKKKPE